MAHEGHGNHWERILGDVAQIRRWLPVMVERGRLIGPPPQGGALPDGATFAIGWPDTPLCGLALISAVQETAQPRFVLVSGYPLAAKGIRRRLLVERINPWQNGIEAWITTRLPSGDGPDLTFFDTHFYANRHRLRVGLEAEFILAGLAYTAEVAHPKPVVITKPETIRAMRQGTERPDDLSPIEFHLEGAAMLFPHDKYAPDEYQFQSPVKAVETFDAFDTRITRLTVTVARPMESESDEIDIDLYVSDLMWRTSERPRPGADVGGILWLQGRLAA